MNTHLAAKVFLKQYMYLILSGNVKDRGISREIILKSESVGSLNYAYSMFNK